MASLSLREVTADSVQRPCFVTSVAEVAADAQGLLQHLACGRVITRQPPDAAEDRVVLVGGGTVVFG